MKKYLLLVVLLIGCAGQMPPTGGPEDETPPEIIGVYPEPNSTNVETDVIRFQFSKYVDQGSFQNSLFISPPVDDMEIRWRGRGVEIRLAGELSPGKTYAVTVGTGVKDIREGNRMRESFTLAFSTGDYIDEGEINGRIYWEEPVGVLIFAYFLEDPIVADTLNPADVRPDYITQTGEGGRFRLPYLRWGRYRILGIKDQFGNKLYDKGIDPVGVYRKDLTISEEMPVIEGLNIRMHKPDHTEPFLSRVTAPHRFKIVARFSKALDAASVALDSFQVIDTLSHTPLRLKSYSRRLDTPGEYFLFTEEQQDTQYKLITGKVRDISGNPIMEDGRSIVFRGNPDPPEELPGVTYVIPPLNKQDVTLESNVILQFSTPVKSEKVEQRVTVEDSLGMPLTGEYYWLDEATLSIVFPGLLESKMKYSIIVKLDSLPPLNEMSYEDSTYVSTFVTINRGILGEVKGTVTSDKDTEYMVIAERDGTQYMARLQTPGNYTINNIPQGEYTVWSFEDVLSSGEYDFGEVFPFRGSAPFLFYPDTIRVRSRWSIDGINFNYTEENDITPPE